MSHSLSEPGAHVEVRMLRTLGLLICKAGLLLPVGNAVRISRLIFPAFPTGAIESSVCTVTALAVSSVGIKFPFVPLLYFISTIESDISLPLGFRDFFFYVCNMACLSKFVPARSAGLPGLNGLLTGGEDPGPGVRVPKLYKVSCLGSWCTNSSS